MRVYLIRFFPPDELVQAPQGERAVRIQSYFRQCMGQIDPLLQGIEVVSRQEYLLSAALQGPEQFYGKLRDHLRKTHIGVLVPNERV